MALEALTGVDFGGNKGTNVADGTAANDVPSMAQLWAMVRGLDWKPSARVASTANVSLTGALTHDGVTLANGDIFLAKDQTTASQNGPWVVNTSGAWTRPVWADESTEVTAAMAISVEEGTTNADKLFVLTTNNPITLGTTALAFSAVGSGATYTAGAGLTLSGSTFNVGQGTGIIVNADDVAIDSAYSGLAKRYSVDVPAGSTTATITHNLGTKDVTVAVRRLSTDKFVEPDYVATSTNVVTLTFPSAPAANEFRCTVVA